MKRVLMQCISVAALFGLLAGTLAIGQGSDRNRRHNTRDRSTTRTTVRVHTGNRDMHNRNTVRRTTTVRRTERTTVRTRDGNGVVTRRYRVAPTYTTQRTHRVYRTYRTTRTDGRGIITDRTRAYDMGYRAGRMHRRGGYIGPGRRMTSACLRAYRQGFNAGRRSLRHGRMYRGF
jgi:hypothetical protein